MKIRVDGDACPNVVRLNPPGTLYTTENVHDHLAIRYPTHGGPALTGRHDNPCKIVTHPKQQRMPL